LKPKSCMVALLFWAGAGCAVVSAAVFLLGR
jgi:hypothetical protein